MKNCSTCKERPKSDFNSYCLVCHAERQSAYAKRSSYKSVKKYKTKIREFIASQKIGHCCDCGNTYPPYVMDFDHVRGDKNFNLSIAANKRISLDKVKQEIEKCDLVCANCHRVRTFQRSHFVQ